MNKWYELTPKGRQLVGRVECNDWKAHCRLLWAEQIGVSEIALVLLRGAKMKKFVFLLAVLAVLAVLKPEVLALVLDVVDDVMLNAYPLITSVKALKVQK